MHVGIDCSCLAKPQRTGVARACASLLAALPDALLPDDRVRLLYRISRWRRRRHFERSPDPRFSVGLFDEAIAGFGARSLDVVHGPDVRIPRLRGVPAVSTVHDLSALDLPDIAEERFRRGKMRALADVAARANVILCVSEFTERAFLARFPSARGRTRVVPLGLAEGFAPQDDAAVARVLGARGLARPYLLFVGQIAPRKNLRRLVAAFEDLRARPAFRDLSLVLAGPVKGSGDEILKEALRGPAGGAVHAIGYARDDELPALYAGALAFVFPGKGEGFGLPILEAMACGVPVAAARAGANPGTAGDAAALFDADSSEELAEAVARLAEDSAARADLVARGRARAAQFNWKETARLTVAAYREAARTRAVR